MKIKFKNNYDLFFIFLILFFHFLYLSSFYKLPIYAVYDYYLKTPSDLRDFFWYPSKAFLEKVNIFETYLHDYNFRSYPPGYVPPNYSILHTLIFIPFGFLPFSLSKIFYLFINLILLFNIYKKLRDTLYVKNKRFFLCFCIFLISPTLMLCLKLGQYSIFCLWGFVIYFTAKNLHFTKFISLLIATAKYTFLPIIGLYLLLEKKYKIFFFITLTNIIAIMIYSIYFDISILSAIIAPITMGWKTQAIGAGDLLSFLGNHPQFPFNIVVVALIFFFLKYFIYFNTKRIIVFDLILICVLSLMSFKHLNYDYILVFPAILLIFEKISNKSKIILSCIIFYFLFILPCFLIEPIRYTKYFIFFNLSLNLILLTIALELILKKNFLNFLYKKYNKK